MARHRAPSRLGRRKRWSLPILLGVFLLLLALCTQSVLSRSTAGKPNFYKVLGLKKSATASEIKKAYRRLSLENHPDKSSDPEAPQKFADIAAAYEVLSDKSKRRIYDTQGHTGLERLQTQEDSGQQGRMDPFQMFGNMFGFQQGGRVRRGRKDADGEEIPEPTPGDIVIDLPLTLKDLYLGLEIPASVQQEQLCPHCRGSGAENDDTDIHECSACQGRGFNLVRRQIGPGFIQQIQQPCNRCGGQGRTVSKKCHVCSGRKIMTGIGTLDVFVEPGAADKSYVVFEQAADEIRQQPHPVFKRRGDDLELTLEISLLEALTGWSREIRHLDGHTVRISRGISESSSGEEGDLGLVTAHGEMLTVREEGMPRTSDPGEYGDLLVHVVVQFPEKLTPEQRDALDQILS